MKQKHAENRGMEIRKPVNSGLIHREEVANLLGVSVRSIQNWERQGLIPVIRLGRRRLYRTDSVMSALEKLES